MSNSNLERRENEEDPAVGEDEDTGAQIAPIIRLEEVAVSTGEEEEEVLIDLKAKLYRFDKDGNQWKERGVGTVKLLKHKESSKVRLLMRQAKTLKICANHLVVPSITIQEHAGNDKSCVWHASDFSDGELKNELFCIRFGSVENCKRFMEMFEEAAKSSLDKEDDDKDASSAAGLLENLSVSENKSDIESSGKDTAAAVTNEKNEIESKESEAASQKKEEE